MKSCPFCAEGIQDAAVVCKHCGRDLVAPATPTGIHGGIFWAIAFVSGLLGWVVAQTIPTPQQHALLVARGADRAEVVGSEWFLHYGFTAALVLFLVAIVSIVKALVTRR